MDCKAYPSYFLNSTSTQNTYTKNLSLVELYCIIFFLTVCSCHVMYPLQSESTPYSCLNVKELLARNRHKI